MLKNILLIKEANQKSVWTNTLWYQGVSRSLLHIPMISTSYCLSTPFLNYNLDSRESLKIFPEPHTRVQPLVSCALASHTLTLQAGCAGYLPSAFRSMLQPASAVCLPTSSLSPLCSSWLCLWQAHAENQRKEREAWYLSCSPSLEGWLGLAGCPDGRFQLLSSKFSLYNTLWF